MACEDEVAPFHSLICSKVTFDVHGIARDKVIRQQLSGFDICVFTPEEFTLFLTD